VAIIEGFEIREDLYYDVDNHVWVKVVDSEVLIGLDDVGQYLARRIVFVKPKPPGTFVKKGEPVAMLESVKWVGPLPSPLDGTIVEINQDVIRRPVLINRDPYGSWIARLRPSNLEEGLKGLVTGSEALKRMEEDIRRRGVKKGR